MAKFRDTLAERWHSPELATAADTPATLGAALLYFLKQPSVIVLGGMGLLTLAYRLTLGAFSLWDVALVVGLVAWWPMQEWLIHVLVLHFKPRQLGPLRLDPLNGRKHRAHHRDPWRLSLVFIPLFTVLPGAPLILLGWTAAMPSLTLGLTGAAAYYLLSAHYEWVHYLSHVRYRPRTAHYQRLVDAHRRHHFKSERHWYGVSMTLGDRILGTAPALDSIPTSPTVRTLGVGQPGQTL